MIFLRNNEYIQKLPYLISRPCKMITTIIYYPTDGIQQKQREVANERRYLCYGYCLYHLVNGQLKKQTSAFTTDWRNELLAYLIEN